MKLVLVKEGSVFRPATGSMPNGLPDGYSIEVEIHSGLPRKIEIWEPLFTQGIEQCMEEALKEYSNGKKS